MAKAKQSNLEMYRNAAQYFTMAAAILYVVVWVATDLMNNKSSTTDSIGSVLIVATMVGGVVMGLLYLVHLSSKK
jgi:hypothetical protein